jgi:hypothetical protein
LNRKNLLYAFDYLEVGYGEVEYSLNRLSKLVARTNETIPSLTNAKRTLEIVLDYIQKVLQSEHFPTPGNADQRILNHRNLSYAFDYLQLGFGEIEYSLNRLSKSAAKANETSEGDKTTNQNETENSDIWLKVASDLYSALKWIRNRYFNEHCEYNILGAPSCVSDPMEAYEALIKTEKRPGLSKWGKIAEDLYYAFRRLDESYHSTVCGPGDYSLNDRPDYVREAIRRYKAGFNVKEVAFILYRSLKKVYKLYFTEPGIYQTLGSPTYIDYPLEVYEHFLKTSKQTNRHD